MKPLFLHVRPVLELDFPFAPKKAKQLVLMVDMIFALYCVFKRVFCKIECDPNNPNCSVCLEV